jgi:uncharacterized protein YodC (DUF2158 family)
MPGDVVTMKSGGPNMMCAEIQEADNRFISCYWFDTEDHLQFGVFYRDHLVKMVDPS